MKHALLTLVVLGLVPVVGNAAEPEAMDAEFLEYLAEFEDDDWTWFASDDKDDEITAPGKPVPAKVPENAHEKRKVEVEP